MKDLTHYFVDMDKSPETPKIRQNGVTNGAGDTEDVTVKKRGRVKIKISQGNNEEKMCDIIESKHDLVDKTPSPFTAPKEKAKVSPGGTPKRRQDLEDETSDVEIEEVDSDSSGGSIFSLPEKKNEKNGRVDEAEESRKVASSNAFQVLMTRSKPVQYLPQKPVSPEEEAAAAKKNQEVKSRMKQNKERLTALADKKGYSKRKLQEAEEAERIEKRLENRAKVFKRLKREEDTSGNQNQRHSGGLHNYFSKMTPEDREKEKLLALSTVTVKAEIHASDLGNEASKVVVKPKTTMKAAKNKIRKVLAAIDDIQVLRSESPSPPPVVTASPEPPGPINQPKPSKKPKWSLRINLSGGEVLSKDEANEFEAEEIPEVLPKPKKKKTKEKSRKSSSNSDSKNPKTKPASREIPPAVPKDSKPNPEAEEVPPAPETPPDSLDDSLQILELPKPSKKLEKLPRSDSDPLPAPKKTPEPSELIHMHSQPLPDPEVTEIKVQKLAPLFIKRQKPDPEVVAARKSFLYCRSPEDPKKKLKKSPVPGPSILPFPSISHVIQHSPSKAPENPPASPRVPSRVPWIHTPTFNPSDFKSLNTSDVSKPQKNSRRDQKQQKANPEDILTEIESRCAEARDLWSAISPITQPTKESPKLRGRKRKSLEKNPPLLEAEKNLESVVWTQKYRPLTAKQIVGNEEAAMKLKSWLEAWQSTGRDDYSSGEEFYSSDNSFQNNLETNQVAVLLGPHGSGKTASVYAVAEELGYTVLELNASSRRPGKKILKDFEEATKSHRIKKTDSSGSSSQTFQKAEKIPQNSLILVEDVDLVFDEDEGFVSATCQLASNTKRPIVMTCRGACAHLNRMAPQQMRIYYQGMCGDRVGALLEVITLAEAGTRLPLSCVEKLLAKGDLRRAVLQLQYLVLSGVPQAGEVPSGFGETLWADVKSHVYKPAVKSEKKMRKRREKGQETREDLNSDVLQGLSNDLETISLLSNFVEIDDRVLTVSEVKFEPCLSLLENEDLYSRNRDQMMEISQWVRDRVMDREGGKDERTSSNQFLLMKKELNFGVTLALSQVASNNLDGYSIRTDYLPTVRTICRAEELKINNNVKRGNRFFHYLQSLRLPSASTKANVLATACKIMQDDNQ
ncbi:replication factor C subunit 1 [Diachasma alloeum]|uniref:replication factor C subunit 1 n=1 Tax=Diachasma alloeum TaxID=454923 RepID=UPI0007384F78|nr:replication factor C subunit 1 [Diachasma alloeum]